MKVLTPANHVNGWSAWFPAVYMSCLIQNFRLFLTSYLPVHAMFCSCIRSHYSNQATRAGGLAGVLTNEQPVRRVEGVTTRSILFLGTKRIGACADRMAMHIYAYC